MRHPFVRNLFRIYRGGVLLSIPLAVPDDPAGTETSEDALAAGLMAAAGIKKRMEGSMKLRYMVSLLRVLKIRGLFPIMKDWQAFLRIHFLFAAEASGLLRALGHPCKRESLIEKLQVARPELLDALLDMGLALKELAIKNNRFLVRGKRSKAVQGEGGDILGAMIQANVTYYSDAYRNAAGRLKGGDLGDDLHEIGDLVARFSKGAEPIVQSFVRAMVRGKKEMQVLDVGCGSGVFMKTAHSANPNASGFGLEIDGNVVRQAMENISKWGLNDRFHVLEGDVRRLPKEISGPFHLITLFNILYYFDPKDRTDLLKRLREILSPKGVLAVIMNFHSQGKDIGAANLNMVNCSLKGLYPLPGLGEMTSLLKHCGFGSIEVHRFMPGTTFCGIAAYR